MAIHIENLQIEQFRGIQQLSVPRLNHINLIAGDNNCGKTSFLEALLLLQNPEQFTNTLQVARMRDRFTMFGGATTYENLLALFPRSANIEETVRMISLRACCNGENIAYSLQGKIRTILLDKEEQKTLIN